MNNSTSDLLVLGIDSYSKQILEEMPEYVGVETVYLNDNLDSLMTLDITSYQLIAIVSKSINDKNINLLIDFVRKINSMNIITTIIIDEKHVKNLLAYTIFYEDYCSIIIINTEYKENCVRNESNYMHDFNSLAIDALKLLCSYFVEGLICFDLADVGVILMGGSYLYFGTGVGKDEGKARIAAENCINSIKQNNKDCTKFKSIFFTIETNDDITGNEINEISSVINDAFNSEANIVFSTYFNNNLTNEIHVSLIAGGFDHNS